MIKLDFTRYLQLAYFKYRLKDIESFIIYLSKGSIIFHVATCKTYKNPNNTCFHYIHQSKLMKCQLLRSKE